MVLAEQVEPRNLVAARHVASGVLRKRQVRERMSLAHLFGFAAGRKSLRREHRIVSSMRYRGASAPATASTRLCSTSVESASITSLPSSLAGPATASASSRRKPPENTDSRASRTRAGASSNSWLHVIVAASVCCRAGRSRAPEPGRSRRVVRRSAMARAGNSAMRAAASSMPSGSPSSRRQISMTAGASSGVRTYPGRTRRARSTNRRTASDDSASASAGRSIRSRWRYPKRANRELLLEREPQGSPAGDHDAQAPRGLEVALELIGRGEQLFVIVEQYVAAGRLVRRLLLRRQHLHRTGHVLGRERRDRNQPHPEPGGGIPRGVRPHDPQRRRRASPRPTRPRSTPRRSRQRARAPRRSAS